MMMGWIFDERVKGQTKPTNQRYQLYGLRSTVDATHLCHSIEGIRKPVGVLLVKTTRCVSHPTQDTCRKGKTAYQIDYLRN
jgi:hypothetical protein